MLTLAGLKDVKDDKDDSEQRIRHFFLKPSPH